MSMKAIISDVEDDPLELRVEGDLLIMEATVGDANTTIALDLVGVRLLLVAARQAEKEMRK